MNTNFTDIYNSIQELAWYFGNQGFSGECCGNLSLIEYMALKKVHDRNNSTIQEIGDSLNITKSGASKIIDRLENKDYIFRKQSSVDGRVCCVAITEKGLDAITKIHELYSDYLGEMFKDFEPNSVENIRNVLEALITSVQKQGYIKSNSHEKDGECC